jgi:hypothetical protein
LPLPARRPASMPTASPPPQVGIKTTRRQRKEVDAGVSTIDSRSSPPAVLSPPNSLAQQPNRHAPLSATRGRVHCRRRLGRLPPQSYVGSASPSCSSSSPSPCFPSWATVVVVAAPQQPCPPPHQRRANAHLRASLVHSRTLPSQILTATVLLIGVGFLPHLGV